MYTFHIRYTYNKDIYFLFHHTHKAKYTYIDISDIRILFVDSSEAHEKISTQNPKRQSTNKQRIYVWTEKKKRRNKFMLKSNEEKYTRQ